jgi:hypothetical protein
MIDYFEKYKNFDAFSKHYKPVSFRLFGLGLSESVPKRTALHQPHKLWLKTKVTLGFRINYFNLRPSLEPEDKKRGDMAFITHYIRGNDDNHNFYESLRFWITRLRYLPELVYINGKLMTPVADKYSLRWGYLLDVNPSFVDLIHGTDPDNAFYGLENIF